MTELGSAGLHRWACLCPDTIGGQGLNHLSSNSLFPNTSFEECGDARSRNQNPAGERRDRQRKIVLPLSEAAGQRGDQTAHGNGVGSPDSEGTRGLSSIRRVQVRGIAVFLRGSSQFCVGSGQQPAPLHSRHDRDHGADVHGLLVRAASSIRRSEWGSLVPLAALSTKN